MAQNQNVVIGIDLGTTYSAVAHVDEHGEARIIPNTQNERITPSVVLFMDEENQVVVGKSAKDEIVLQPERVVDFVKREMGKKKTEVRAEDNSGVPKPYNFWGRTLSPEDISAYLLKRLKQDAEIFFGFPVTDAVITVPAYFNDSERQATKDAGTMAGLNVRHILNEPTAAALAYGVMKADKPQTVFVFDLGGGTFDVTILKIEIAGAQKNINMIQTNGDHRLGGKDWDDRLIKYVAEQFQHEHGLDPYEDMDARGELRERSENTKKSLSTKPSASMMCSAHGKKSKIDLTREKFEELTADLMERCHDLCKLVLEEAKMSWRDIDTILLAGGSTRMPMVQEMLKRISGKTLRTDLLNPDECVALGAAIQGTILAVKDSKQTGAKISQVVLDKMDAITAQDVTSHRLGLVVRQKERSVVAEIIPKGTRVPCSLTDTFGTVVDNQANAHLIIKEGESDDPDLVTTIQEATLPILNPLPAGAPIEVTYQFSAEGILKVIARDLTNNKSIQVEVERKGNLTPAEVKQGAAQLQKVAVSA